MNHFKIGKFKQIIGILLCIALIATLCDWSMVAQAVSAGQNSIVSEDVKESKEIAEKDNNASKADGAYELKDERTKNSTTYQLADGRKQVVYYSDNVRYRDEKGNLVDYDASLVKIKDKKTKNNKSLTGYLYENAKGDMKNYIPKEINEKTPVLLENGKYFLEVTPILTGNQQENAFASAGELNSIEAVKEKVTDIYGKSADKYTTAVYSSSDNSFSLEYTSHEQGVKENIVLNEVPSSNVWKFEFTLSDGLTAKKDTCCEGISFFEEDTDEIAGGIQKPYMDDATGENYSEAITYDLEKKSQESNTYVLTMTVDSSYLSNPNTVYPVTIDPFYSCAFLTSNLSDVYVLQGDTYRKLNYYSSSIDAFFVGRTPSCGIARTYITFTGLADEVKGHSIDSADLTVYETGTGKSGMTIRAHKTKEAYKKSEITWETRAAYANTVLSTVTSTSTKNKARSFDITSYVRSVANGSDDYGIVLRTDDEDTVGDYVKFYGSRYSNVDYRPKLTVSYYEKPTKATSVSFTNAYIQKGKAATVSWEGIESYSLKAIQYRLANYDKTNQIVGDNVIQYADSVSLGNTSSGTKKIADSVNWKEGEYRLYLRGLDNGGNVGTGTGATLIIDGTKPVMSASSGVDSSSYILGPPTVSWSVTEKYFSQVEYSVNGSAYKTLSTEKTKQKAALPSDLFTASGTYKISLRAKDKAGNVSTAVSSTCYVDKTAPSAPSVSGNPTAWTKSDVTLKASSSDSHSGISQYSFSNDKTTKNWQTSASKTYTKNCTVYVDAKDKVGNISEQIAIIINKIDKTAPVIKNISSTIDADTGKMKIKVTATDAASGVSQYSFDGGTTWQSSSEKLCDSLVNSWSVCVKDNVGNIASKTGKVLLPEIYTDGIYVGILDVADTGNIQYKVDNGEWTDYKHPFAISHDRDVIVYARCLDTPNSIVQKKYTADINKYIGAYTETDADMTLTYKDISFELSRSYNSYDKKWTFSFDTNIEKKNGSLLNVTLPDGTIRAFEKQDGDIYRNILTGYQLKVKYNEDHSTVQEYVLELDSMVYQYDANGKLKTILDTDGNCVDVRCENNQMTFTYGPSSQKRSYSIQFHSGKPIAMVNPLGEKLIYQYDTDGNLTSVYYDNDTLLVKRDGGIILNTYVYANGVMTKNNFMTLTYSDGRLQQESYSDDESNNRQYTYKTLSDGYSVAVQSEGEQIEEKVYDKTVNLTSSTDSEGSITSYEYDEYYRVAADTKEDVTTEYTYNTGGKVISESSNGVLTEYIYDDSGEKLLKTVRTEESVDEETEETSLVCEYTYYIYENNLLVYVFSSNQDYNSTHLSGQFLGIHFTASDDKQSYEYSNGELTSMSSYMKNAENIITEQTITYSNQEPVKTVTVQTDAGAAKQISKVTKECTYDAFGNVIKEVTTTEGSEDSVQTVQYEYDALNRRTQYSDETTETTDIYDAADNTLKETVITLDKQSNSSKTEVNRTIYDKFGRVIQDITEGYDTAKDSLSNASDSYTDSSVGEHYVYDEEGRVVEERNKHGITSLYTYGSNGKMSAETVDKYVYTYNENGDITKITIAGNDYADYTYDENNHLTQIQYANGQTEKYTYDSSGNISARYHNNSSGAYVIYEYTDSDSTDGKSTLASKTNYDTMQKTYYKGDKIEVYQIRDDGTETLYYSYVNTDTQEDEEEQTETEIETEIADETDVQKTVESHYYTKGKDLGIKRVTKNDNSTYTIGNHTFNTQIVKNDEDKIESLKVSAADKQIINSTYTYNEDGELIVLSEQFENQELNHKYQYDENENIVYYEESSDSYVHYLYDNKEQLIRVDNHMGELYTETYEYDKRGNLVRTKRYSYTRDSLDSAAPTKTDTFRFQTGDDVWEDEMTVAQNDMTYIYDECGNPVKVSIKDLTWTSGRQLASISFLGEDGHVYKMSYTYDENHYRTSKAYSVDNVVESQTNYTVENGYITSQSDGTNTIVYIYDEDDSLAAMSLNGEIFYYVFNGRGDVIGLCDGQGNLLFTYRYDAWGTPDSEVVYYVNENDTSYSVSVSELAMINPMRYRQYYWDSDINMYYLQSRYYLPTIHRFLNADLPEIAKDYKDEFVGTNLFAYCGNNPVKYVDNTGYCYFKMTKKGRKWVHSKACSGKRIGNPLKTLIKTNKTMAICTDGVPDSERGKKVDGVSVYKDWTPSPMTTLCLNNHYIHAGKINYVVIPLDGDKRLGMGQIVKFECKIREKTESGKKIITKTIIKTQYAIVADNGPEGKGKDKYNEISIGLAWKLGFEKATGKWNGSKEDYKFISSKITYFLDSAKGKNGRGWKYKTLQKDINKYGKKYSIKSEQYASAFGFR